MLRGDDDAHRARAEDAFNKIFLGKDITRLDWRLHCVAGHHELDLRSTAFGQTRPSPRKHSRAVRRA
jgi:hypothetical protein